MRHEIPGKTLAAKPRPQTLSLSRFRRITSRLPVNRAFVVYAVRNPVRFCSFFTSLDPQGITVYLDGGKPKFL